MKRRPKRVAEAIRRLAGEIVHSQLRDPRIKGFVTVTRVEVTQDLRFAKIYYTTLCEDGKKKLIARGLKSAKNYIRKRIGDELELRYAPDISLRVDKGIEYSNKIEGILNKLKEGASGEGDKKNSERD